jgi:ABC transport system ATP-binding/permease protein
VNQASSFRVAVREGPLAGTEFAVTGEMIVGRVEAAITIPDPEISRRHAVLRTTPLGLEIEDLGSLNGTYVNGEQITKPVQLRPDDLIRLGDTSMALRAQNEAGTVSTDRVKEPPPPPPAVPASGLPPLQPFSPPQPLRRRRAPASRSAAAMVLTVGTVVATAMALIVYFALH